MEDRKFLLAPLGDFFDKLCSLAGMIKKKLRGQADRDAGRQADKQTGIQADRHTDR